MSRQAQAEREKQARVILGSAEAEVAGKFVEAANIYAGHPTASMLAIPLCCNCAPWASSMRRRKNAAPRS
jgi:hypothetical protein